MMKVKLYIGKHSTQKLLINTSKSYHIVEYFLNVSDHKNSLGCLSKCRFPAPSYRDADSESLE